MEEYDLNDPVDVEILRGKFDMYSHDEWDEYIEIAEQNQLGYKNVNILKTALRKAGLGKFLSPKVIKWILSLVDQLDSDDDEYEDEEE